MAIFQSSQLGKESFYAHLENIAFDRRFYVAQHLGYPEQAHYDRHQSNAFFQGKESEGEARTAGDEIHSYST
jgi:hypothetical protein